MTNPALPARIDVATPHIGQEEIDAVADVLRSGQFASGPRVQAFEEAFAAYCGSKYAAAVSDGTAALFIALQSMGIGKGDEVLVPAMTFFASVTSIIYVGATPVFVDIDEDDLCLSPDHAGQVITDRTKCILPVHLFGAAAKMDQINALAQKHNIPVLEDCAQAHGTLYDGHKVGGLGNTGAFSFFATKHMTTGEGGIITSDDPAVIEKAKILRSHGMTGRDDHGELGFNNRMNEIEAALGLVQLGKLDDLNSRRIKNSEYLLEHLSDLTWAHFPCPKEDKAGHTYFWCPLMLPVEAGSIDALKEHLNTHNIGYRHRYSAPLYKQEALRKAGLDYSELYLPNVERITGRVIGLPNHPGLKREDLDRVIDVVRSFTP